LICKLTNKDCATIGKSKDGIHCGIQTGGKEQNLIDNMVSSGCLCPAKQPGEMDNNKKKTAKFLSKENINLIFGKKNEL